MQQPVHNTEHETRCSIQHKTLYVTYMCNTTCNTCGGGGGKISGGGGRPRSSGTREPRLVPGVSFQENGVATDDSMLAWRGRMPELTAFTLCVRTYIIQHRDEDVIISYAVKEYAKEFVVVGKYESEELVFDCCNEMIHDQVPTKMPLLDWMSICVSIDLFTLQIVWAINGKTIKNNLGEQRTKTFVPRTIPGGHLVLGQEQGIFNGSYNAFRSFSGSLVDFNFFGEVISEEELVAFTLCQETNIPQNPVVHLGNVEADFVASGNARKISMNSSILCTHFEDYTVIFPEQRTFDSAVSVCRAAGGVLEVPKTEEENWLLYQYASVFSSACVDIYSEALWLGLRGDHMSGTWNHYLSGTELSYQNFHQSKGEATKEKNCVTMYMNPSDSQNMLGVWARQMCSSYRCASCHFRILAPIRLRGLCRGTLFDREYFLMQDSGGKPYFIGAQYSRILWVPSEREDTNSFGSWRLMRLDKNKTYAEYPLKNSGDYPLGKKLWNLKGDNCKNGKTVLVLTACGQHEYTCYDGQCIDLFRRCDLNKNCLDGSDEKGCEVAVFPEEYSNKISPHGGEDNEALEVKFFFDIQSVRSFVIYDFEYTIEAAVRLEWFDSRLELRYLKDEQSMNSLKDAKVKPWMPKYRITGAEKTSADLKERSVRIYARREALPLPDDDTNYSEDIVFRGSENPIVLTTKMTATIACHFDLSIFPFDVQKCYFKVILSKDNVNHVILKEVDQGIVFTGDKRLMEYSVEGVTITNITQDNYHGMKIVIMFANMAMYHVTNTFLPSLLLTTLGYLPFHFPMDDFQDRIMVSMTSMLVLTSFSSQVATTIPRTAYLKVMDVWLNFCTITVFLIVVALTVVNFVKEKDGVITRVRPFSIPSKSPPPPPPSLTKTSGRDQSRADRLNRFFYLYFPTSSLLFIALFVISSLALRSNAMSFDTLH
ncbi:uncharacterized protein LOC143028722 [Oratosquilla oratoria]|uniref:uncharacterized protein LOC143028722 n=1 Tax=Oratosquilla oratoria TaxID=337810 RepID=UPI003F765376